MGQRPYEDGDAGWSSPVARQAHNLKAAGSNPAPATNDTNTPARTSPGVFVFVHFYFSHHHFVPSGSPAASRSIATALQTVRARTACERTATRHLRKQRWRVATVQPINQLKLKLSLLRSHVARGRLTLQASLKLTDDFAYLTRRE